MSELQQIIDIDLKKINEGGENRRTIKKTI